MAAHFAIRKQGWRAVAAQTDRHRDVIETPERHMRAAYAGVVAVEIVVLLALWLLSSIFSR
jgi:hypothetical protein